MAKHDGSEFENGDQVRVKKTGRIVFLDEINDKSKADREAADEYWCTEAYEDPESLDGHVDIDNPEEVELVTKAKDVVLPSLPKLKELTEYVAGSLFGGMGEIQIDETDTGGEPDGQLLFYGKSPSGKRFGARITISEVEPTSF